MVSKIFIALCVVAVAAAIPQGAGLGGNPWAGGNGNPWATGTGSPWAPGTGNPWAMGTGNPWANGAGNPWATGTGNPWASAGTNPYIPPWVATAPWFPQWTSCTAIGASCVDCNTKQICTKIGGITRACNDPTLPYCNLGECSATPSAECQTTTSSSVPPAPVVNA